MAEPSHRWKYVAYLLTIGYITMCVVLILSYGNDIVDKKNGQSLIITWIASFLISVTANMIILNPLQSVGAVVLSSAMLNIIQSTAASFV
jgi:hypothetical protein